MAFPLVPFAAGLAVGSLTTVGVTDKALRTRVVEGTKDIYNRVSGAAASKTLHARVIEGTKGIYGRVSDAAAAAAAMLPRASSAHLDLSGMTQISDTVAAKITRAADAVADTIAKPRKRATPEAEN
jgi:hypothetical protein